MLVSERYSTKTHFARQKPHNITFIQVHYFLFKELLLRYIKAECVFRLGCVRDWMDDNSYSERMLLSLASLLL